MSKVVLEKQKERKQAQEVQETLTPKSAGEKFSSFKNGNSVANCEVISKF